MKVLPPAEALKYWSDKVILSPEEYKELASEAKHLAFSVSEMARADHVQAVYDAIQDGIRDGKPFGEFKREAGEFFDGLGWGGSSENRAELVYHNAVSQAYSAGHSQQLDADRDIFPHRRYVCSLRATRPEHRRLHGLVLRSDDPVWSTMYTPNGHRCECDIEGVAGYSGKVVTGAELNFQPDPGWAGNPGRTGLADQDARFASRIEQYPEFLAADVASRLSNEE